MNIQKLIDALTQQQFDAEFLKSGRIRFEKDGKTYLLTPNEYIAFGTWFNEQNYLNEKVAA
jgi:two-component sensor histidine kinase